MTAPSERGIPNNPSSVVHASGGQDGVLPDVSGGMQPTEPSDAQKAVSADIARWMAEHPVEEGLDEDDLRAAIGMEPNNLGC